LTTTSSRPKRDTASLIALSAWALSNVELKQRQTVVLDVRKDSAQLYHASFGGNNAVPAVNDGADDAGPDAAGRASDEQYFAHLDTLVDCQAAKRRRFR
jgi:hypothetical protein